MLELTRRRRSRGGYLRFHVGVLKIFSGTEKCGNIVITVIIINNSWVIHGP